MRVQRQRSKKEPDIFNLASLQRWNLETVGSRLDGSRAFTLASGHETKTTPKLPALRDVKPVHTHTHIYIYIYYIYIYIRLYGFPQRQGFLEVRRGLSKGVYRGMSMADGPAAQNTGA